MTTPQLIGLTAYAQSGKDAAAAALVEDGWQRRAFADVLREFAYTLNPLIEKPASRATGIAGRKVARLADLVDEYGWDHVKVAYPEARALLQRLGTDAGRRLLGEDVWVDAALTALPRHRGVVLTDVRFPNEADAIRARGGVVVRVTRPGVGPVNGHVSETAMDDYVPDVVIANDGTLDDLHAAIRDVATTRR